MDERVDQAVEYWAALSDCEKFGLSLIENGSMGFAAELYIVGGYEETMPTSIPNRLGRIGLTFDHARALRDWLTAHLPEHPTMPADFNPEGESRAMTGG